MASNLLLGLLVYLIGVNGVAFFLYGLDKYKARRQQCAFRNRHCCF